MIDLNEQLVHSRAGTTGDAEAISYLQESINSGKNWYISLLESMGLWVTAEEVYNERTYRYLIEGEAFDWLLLAERLCDAVDGLLPQDEKNGLLFYGRPPLSLNSQEAAGYIGEAKYRQYLNFFYGVMVEGVLVLAVEEEVIKERGLLGSRISLDPFDEAYRRIYNVDRVDMLKRFRQEKGYSHLRSTTLSEQKEFTYWLFKYRLKKCEKARIASDTKKALDYLLHQWRRKGICGVLTTDSAASGES